MGEAVAAGIDAVPSLRARLPALSGSELPPALRSAAWKAMMTAPGDIEKCDQRLRASPLAVAAAGLAQGASTPMLSLKHRLDRGLSSCGLSESERALVEARASALLIQAQECGADDTPTLRPLRQRPAH